MLVVLVNGLSGSGKTTLAHALGLPLFSKDRIKESLADTKHGAVLESPWLGESATGPHRRPGERGSR
ncbi:hypothetical protein [Microbispora sp. CA-102843]|uniref:hypothetical protein n=1 Tax=Microbispora sp. CA-102843 TaxID=3239952 RepID=UPI003D91F8B7